MYWLIFRYWRRPSLSWINKYCGSSLSWIDGTGLHIRIKENTCIPAPRRDLCMSAWAHNQVRSTTRGVFASAKLLNRMWSTKTNYYEFYFRVVCIWRRAWHLKLSGTNNGKPEDTVYVSSSSSSSEQAFDVLISRRVTAKSSSLGIINLFCLAP